MVICFSLLETMVSSSNKPINYSPIDQNGVFKINGLPYQIRQSNSVACISNALPDPFEPDSIPIACKFEWCITDKGLALMIKSLKDEPQLTIFLDGQYKAVEPPYKKPELNYAPSLWDKFE